MSLMSHHETCGICHAAVCEHTLADAEKLVPTTDQAVERALTEVQAARHNLRTAEDNLVVAVAEAEKVKHAAAAEVPVDRTSRVVLGEEVAPGVADTTLRQDGQQRGYVALSEEERAKGFVRPVRRSYVHSGRRPKHPISPLSAADAERYKGQHYVAFEAYPPGTHGSAIGRYWTEADLKGGCGGTTTMSVALAETWARDKTFYSGTFCSTCAKHLPVEEFVWAGTREVLGT